MKRRLITHGAVLLVALAALTLAACKGAGALPAGQAYLTISNGSTSSYTEVFVDNKTSLPDIAAGNSYRTGVTISPDTHVVSVKFNGSTVTSGPISVPSQGCTLSGPTIANPNFSGC